MKRTWWLLAAAPLLVWVAGRIPAPLPASRVDPDLGVPIGARLRSLWTDASLVMDGQIEPAWERAPALEAPLHDGLHGQEVVGSVELRSLHNARNVYLLARWAAPPLEDVLEGVSPEHLLRNLATVHWRLVDPGEVSGASTGSQGLACDVGCHTATADGVGHLVGIRSETIPPGLDEDLPAGGGWSDGVWTLEWSRPRKSDTPYDQDLIDPAQFYRFFVKLFQGQSGQPDPVSHVHELSLEP